jgi:hypothetical protein
MDTQELEKNLSMDSKLKVKIKYLSPVETFLKDVNHTANGSYVGTKINIGFPLDNRGEYLKTGLTKEEAEKLEKDCFLDTNDLVNPRSEFLKNYEFSFDKSREELLDLSVPLDKLKYVCLLANSNKVVTDLSQKEQKPLAEFLILNDEKEALNSVSRYELKSKVYKAVEGLSSKDFRNILLTLGERVDDLSETQIESKVKVLAEDEPVRMLKLITEVKSEPIKAEFNEMLHYQVIVNKSGYYVVNDEKADSLGRNVEDATNFLKSPSNKELTALLKSRLKEAKSRK